MTEEDRLRWDARYAGETAGGDTAAAGLPAVFASYEGLFPSRGHALELACGRGRASVWLACRGLEVLGVDISSRALADADNLADRAGVADRCRFEVADLDRGLPSGPPADVLLCHMFRDARLDAAVVDRLAAGGLLAIATRSQVGGGPGPFRAAPGELAAAFSRLSVLAGGEGDGRAWLLARKGPGVW